MAALREPIPADAAPAPFAEAVARAEAGQERVVLTRAGRPVAAVVPIADMEALEAIDAAEDERDAALVREARARWEREGVPTTTLEELAARYGIELSGPA